MEKEEENTHGTTQLEKQYAGPSKTQHTQARLLADTQDDSNKRDQYTAARKESKKKNKRKGEGGKGDGGWGGRGGGGRRKRD